MAAPLVAPTIRSQRRRDRSGIVATLLTALFPAEGWEQKSQAAVIATNSHGESRRLFVTSTNEEAAEKAARVDREWTELGPEAWSERYKVPLDWLR